MKQHETKKYSHVVEWAAPVQKALHPDGEIIPEHDSNDLQEIRAWAEAFMHDNPGIAASYVIENS